MLVAGKERCIRCMHLLDEKGHCAKCEFDASSYKQPNMALPLGTCLNERYFLGKVLGEGGFGITYTGYDNKEKRPVAIKEYFPANIVSRDTNSGRSQKISCFDGKDGKYYGFPTHVGTTVAFYNDDLLKEAGIDYTTIKTWDDFKAAGVKYHEKTGKNFACAETTAQWMVNLMLAQKGTDYLDKDGNLDLTNDKVVEVLQYIKDMQDAGALATVAGGQPDNEEAYPEYNSGNFAVQIMPFWQTSRFTNYMSDLEGKIAIAAPPVFGDNDAVKTIGGGGTGTAVVKSSKNADLAAEVFAYIKLSEDANKEVWNVLGFDPVNTSVWTDTDLTQNPDNQFVKYFKTKPFDTLLELQDSIGGLNSYTSSKYPSINNEFCTTTLNNIFEEGMDVKDALKQSQETLENEFGDK